MTAAARTDALDDLAAVVAELGQVLALERAAISRLDVDRLRATEDDKERLAAAIHELIADTMPSDPSRRNELLGHVRRVRNDLHANALLIAAAADAVRAALGFEDAAGYDRLARRAAPTRPMRVLTAL